MASAAKRGSWKPPLIALCLYFSFWATAIAADWFVDKPFSYLGRPIFATNLALSGTRWLPRSESLLTSAAMVFLIPAIIVASIDLARRVKVDPLEWWFERSDAQRTVVVLAVTIAMIGAAFVAFGLIGDADIIDDERSYVFQARLFAHGVVGLPTPPAALRNPLLLLAPMWTSPYPPGHSLVLAPAAAFHAEHFVPVVLAGVLVLAVWSFARDMFGPKHATLAAMFAGASPFVWAVHGTVMAFGTATTSLAVFLAALARAERTKKSWWMLVSGLAVGLAFITRPYEALAFSLPFAIRLLWEARRPDGGTRARLAWCAVGFIAIAWLLLAHNFLVTGNAWEMPYRNPSVGAFHLGFTQSYPPNELVHSPWQAIGNLVGVVQRLDLWALGWPGSLLLVVAGTIRRDATRGDRMLRWAVASYVACYLLVPMPGTWDVGPSYYYALLPLLIPLAVRGVSSLRDRFAALDPGLLARRAVGWAVLAGVAVAMLTIFPMRAIYLAELSSEIRAPWEAIEESDLGPSIVIVPGMGDRRAAGWAFGHPYTLTTKRGATVELISPASQRELDDAVAFLGNKPLYELLVDKDVYAETGRRRFTLQPLAKP